MKHVVSFKCKFSHGVGEGQTRSEQYVVHLVRPVPSSVIVCDKLTGGVLFTFKCKLRDNKRVRGPCSIFIFDTLEIIGQTDRTR